MKQSTRTEFSRGGGGGGKVSSYPGLLSRLNLAAGEISTAVRLSLGERPGY